MNPGLSMPEEGMTTDELSNFVAEQLKRLNLVLKNIDGLNIVDIKFELKGGAYIQLNRKGLIFNDGTKDTLLTDINGNVTLTGRITASTVVGSEIMTAEGEYPRVEMTSTGNLFAAYQSSDEFIKMMANYLGTVTLLLNNAVVNGSIGPAGNVLLINTAHTHGGIQISSGTDLELYADLLDPTKLVRTNSWSRFKNEDSGHTLQQDLDAKQNRLTGGDITVIDGVATLNAAIPATKIGSGIVDNTEFGYLNGVNDNIQTQLNAKAAAAQPAVIAPTLLNGWVNDAGWQSAGYYKDTLGIVHLQGFIKNGTVTAGTVLFNLPAGYRPAVARMIGAKSAGTSAAAITIDAAGDVKVFENVSASWLSLENISFRP